MKKLTNNAPFFLKEGDPLSALFTAASEGIVIINRKGIIIGVNPMAEKTFGYGQNELIDQPIETLVPDSLKKTHVSFRNSSFEQPKMRTKGDGKEFQAQKKDGSTFIVEISISPLEIEGEHYYTAFVNDITKRKIAEKEVIEQRQLLEYYADYAPAAIAMLDLELKYLVASARWKKTILDSRQDLSDVIGHSITEDYYFKEDWKNIFQNVLLGQKTGIQLDHIQKFNGDTVCIEWEAHPWYNNDREISGIIIFAEDVTTRIENENKVQQYLQELISKNRELEDFAYVSSHDLQEPLRKIRAFGDRLQKKEKENLSDKGKDYIDRMLSSAERMQQLISDLLRFSRISSKAKPFGEIDLNKILEDVLSDLEISITDSNAEINLPDLPTIKGDETQLRQLFQNLISNAIKFKQDDLDPVVKITFKEDENQPNFIYISVEDNGIGFDQKYSDRIFQIFQRLEGRKYNGSGIGLAICKKIAQRHGGDITAESVINKGTVFTISMQTNIENGTY
ncbi:PAS domain S-box protein [Flammeovirga yaeyamensis]|uniref:histidine kinase n=1 Tax=Flammeovirga yaeyamensis TaxID=367791 RepID=A0AAX1N9F1_9BACT|nr:PAS domain S-box protein [Flammeovirga yaeyamensis]MBB3697428.1 PAS domain S-box-containing protein [Flammeovirga yaeyamensis]NMF36122.1 PAS domain S-box protein [Flammeovirga yaeyamensis]QWG02855.1 PAS domain S-box protein [Flammeovirga yaeyamensis]